MRTSKNPNGQRVSIPSGSEENGTESSGLMNFKPSNENFSYFWNIKQQAYVSVEGKIYSEGTWVDGFNSINSSDYSRVTPIGIVILTIRQIY
ncbi:MAG: hypothetical protein IPH33_01690 [Bacteroidetes bacterium]|nr:hypothetical protein [Bacteroidota bacterium]